MHSCSPFCSFLMFIGRVFFSLIFIVAGYYKIVEFQTTAASMVSAGVPYADIVLIAAIIFELGGGILVLLGWYARFGAFLIFLFIIPVTYFFHSYWTYEGVQMVNNFHHFMKNLAMAGGALYIMSCGAGKISVDGFFRKKDSCH